MMAHYLFAATDIGGGLVLSPAIAAALAADDAVSLAAGGASAEIWRAQFGDVKALPGGTAASAALVRDLGPAVVVTGTSGTSAGERDLWSAARQAGVPSVAVLDTWINFEPRFRDKGSGGGFRLPDTICVVNEESRRALVAQPWCDAALEVVGQPYLEAAMPVLSAARRDGAAERKARPAVWFLSEPWREKEAAGSGAGLDQFHTASAVVRAAGPETEIVVVPHPREDPSGWATWRAEVGAGASTIRVWDERMATRRDLMANACRQASVVVGMTSMALIEAALAGVPVISVQIGRTRAANPVFDRVEGFPLVREEDELAPALAACLQTTDTAALAMAVERAVCPTGLKGSTQRLAAVLKRTAGAG
jgi:hypothetical protein